MHCVPGLGYIYTAIHFIKPLVPPGIAEGVGIVQKLQQVAKAVFKLGQSACFFLLGSKDFYFDGIKKSIKASWYYLVHGSLFMASSTAGLLCLAHNYKIIRLGCGFTFLNILGNGLFFAACCFSLHFHTKLLIEAVRIPADAGVEEKAKAKTELRSAAMGVINASSYIIATGCIILGGPVAIGVIFGTIALTIGTIKFFYDLFYLRSRA